MTEPRVQQMDDRERTDLLKENLQTRYRVHKSEMKKKEADELSERKSEELVKQIGKMDFYWNIWTTLDPCYLPRWTF